MSQTEIEPRPDEPSDQLAAVAARACAEKLAVDIAVLEVGPVLGVCDWFVIASGANPRQVKAITDEVEMAVQIETDRSPVRTEGADTRRWVILDYGDVAVHVFHQEDREFYRLERLFSDVRRMKWS